jgi:hypothetical protein
MGDPQAERREAEAVLDAAGAGADAAARGETHRAWDLLTVACAEAERLARGSWLHGVCPANLAAVQRDLGDVGAAMENIQKAVFLLHNAPEARAEALPSALTTRAVLQRTVGDLDRALADAWAR